MHPVRSIGVDALARWSARAFLAAGLVWVVDGILLGASLLRVAATGTARSGLVLTALAITLAGILGLVPRISTSAPRLARGGALAAGLGIAAIGLQFAWGAAGVVLDGVASPPATLAAVVGTLVVGGVTAVGVGCLTTGGESRPTGVLLLALVGALVGAAIARDWVQLGLVGGLAAIALAIGYRQHAAGPPPRPTEPGVDTTG